MNTVGSKIFVAGHQGLVGSAIVRRLVATGTSGVVTRTRGELDLLDQAAVDRFFREEQPEQVYLAAAKVGGILANSTWPAEFIHSNLLVQTHVIHSAWRHGVRKLCFLGSSCIYPVASSQPMREEYLLSGPLETTNQPYAIAKIAGIAMCQAYRTQYGFDAISLMPTNLYGPGDNFSEATSHVLAALIRKIHDAMQHGDGEVVIWGTGTPRREFLHVDDFADAAVHLMKTYSSGEIINVGAGQDLSIRELAELVARIVGYKGRFRTDPGKPDGAPRKLLDISRLNRLGWSQKISLDVGIRDTYRWYLSNLNRVRL